MSACSNFTSDVWKPNRCRQCFQQKEEHVIDQISTNAPSIVSRQKEFIEVSNNVPPSDIPSSEQETECIIDPENTTPTLNQIPCQYGANCYRKNPTHFEKYSHPPALENSNVQQKISRKQLRDSVAYLYDQNKALEEAMENLRLQNEQIIAYQRQLENVVSKEMDEKERHEIEKQRILEVKLDTPNYWGRNAFDSPYREIEISSEAPEYSIVNDLLNSTIETHDNKYGTIYGEDPTEFIVTKITRIHNRKLWYDYCYKKENILNKNNNQLEQCESSKYLLQYPLIPTLLDTNANEYWLFHGCDDKLVQALTYSGYDPRLSNVRGMFGGGFYLAENSSKSNQYIPCVGCGKNAIFYLSGCDCKNPENFEYSMILYRAVLGDIHIAKEYDKKIYRGKKENPVRRPPVKPNSLDTYDSIMGESKKYGGNELNYREFILYEPGQAYPEYVIKFKRSVANARPPSDIQSIKNRCYNFLRNVRKIRPE